MVAKKGYTLVEIMVATATMAILSLIIASIFQTVSTYYMRSKEKINAEETAAKAELLFKQYFSQAIFVQQVIPPNPVNNNIIAAGNHGEVRDAFVFDQIADTPTDFTLIANFLRESATAIGVPAAVSRIRRTAIWYRRPTATTSGVIFFGIDPNPGAAADPPAFSPTYDQPYIDRVSAFSMTPRVHSLYDRAVMSLSVQMRIRYQTNLSSPKNWCPAADIDVTPECVVANANWSDLDVRFDVLLRNNRVLGSVASGLSYLGSASRNEERVLGSLYFFQPIVPRRWQ